MTVATPAPAVPLMLGLCTVADHTAQVYARPAPGIPRRHDLFWSTLQPTNPTNAAPGHNDTFNPGILDTIHAQAAANGITHLVLTLGYCQMTWAGGSGDGHQLPRAADVGSPDYANIHRLASLYWHTQGYDQDVHPYWEDWNEPQLGFAGPVNLTLRANYIKMLQARANAARNGVVADRSGLAHYTSGDDLWTGGTGQGAGSGFNHYDWLAAIVDADPDCFDHVAFHPYSSGCPMGTVNSYDPFHKYAALMRQKLDGAGRTDAYLNATEVGWFWRPDGTTNKPDCGDGCNCNSYGDSSVNPNFGIEVDVTTMATRISQVWPTWKGQAATLKLGGLWLFQQDTNYPNNTDTTDGSPKAAFDHAGLYLYDAGRAGTPTLDGGGNPAPLNAFLALLSTDTTPPSVAIMAPTPGQVVKGTFGIAVATTDAETAAGALRVRWGLDGTAWPTKMPYFDLLAEFGYNRLTYPIDSTDGTWPNGTYTVHVRSIDAAGNKGFDTVTFTVDNAAPTPTVSSLTPASGDVAGATSVAIIGSGFTGVTGPGGVKFGLNNAASYTVVDDSHITAVSPAATAGTVDVTVTHPTTGTSPIVPADQFLYTTTTPTPAVTSATPNTGDVAGATSVVIACTGASGVTQVKFGPTPAASFTIDNPTQITAVSPAAASAGTVAIRLIAGKLKSPLVPADKFTYTAASGPGLPTVAGPTPTSGPVPGGTSVALTGTGFET